jgi:hypothetical protein
MKKITKYDIEEIGEIMESYFGLTLEYTSGFFGIDYHDKEAKKINEKLSYLINKIIEEK